MSQPYHYAGFWRRWLALFLDIVLFFTISAPFMFLVVGRTYFYWLVDNTAYLEGINTTPLTLVQIGFFVFIALCWKFMGSTPGKLLMGCHIIDARTGSKLSWKQVMIRLLGYFISALPLYGGFIWAAFDKHKQGLHDKLAGTLVIYEMDDYARQDIDQLSAGLSGTKK